MGRKAGKNYVDNRELGRLVEDYIRSNPNDRGEWLDRYVNTVKSRNAGKPKKIAAAEEFAQYRRGMYSGQRPTEIYGQTCDKLIPILYKIIDGRMASYRIFGDEDVRQDCMLALLKYMNRFDYRKGTSAFAYVSEIITQAINLHLNYEKDSRLDGNLVYEHELYDYRGVDEMKGNPE